MKRLLTKAEAAAYCGVSVLAFERWCQVRPISLAPAGMIDERLRRWDIKALDAWIDTLGAKTPSTTVDWAALVANADKNQRAQKVLRAEDAQGVLLSPADRHADSR